MGASWAEQKELRLGRYLLKRPLGEGGNGQVFLAWQENEAGEPLVCVVKFPLQRYATQADGRERFLAEARLAMRLGMHPNIVHVIDVGRHRDMPFIVMEYVDGTDLHQLLKVFRGAKQGLSLASAYNILASTAEALHHAHAGATIAGKPVGVVHRDIKPGNILVTRDGVTKVGDFGIGATIEEGTAGQYMRGTHRYMSPEHLRCEVRPEMDMYAFGVVAWEVLENRQFREGIKGPQHFTAIMDGRIPPMENPDTPKQLVSIIEACLESNPRQRPVASEVLRALERCPGYTRDPSSVKADVRKILGLRRSSGQTQHEFTATPELVATLAALEAVQQRPIPSKGATNEGASLHASTTLEGAPPLAQETANTPAPAQNDDIDCRSPSDAETPIARAGVSGPPDGIEEDAPRMVRRPRSQPTPTVPLIGDAVGRDARERTIGLGSVTAAASSGTEFVAPPWGNDAPVARTDVTANANGPDVFTPPSALRRRTTPGVAPRRPGTTEPAPSSAPVLPAASHETIEFVDPAAPQGSNELGRSPASPGSSSVQPTFERGSTEPGQPPLSPASLEAVDSFATAASTAPGRPAMPTGAVEATYSNATDHSTEPGRPPIPSDSIGREYAAPPLDAPISRGSIGYADRPAPRPSTEPAHVPTPNRRTDADLHATDQRSTPGSLALETTAPRPAPIAASPRLSKLRRDLIVVGKLWPLYVALIVISFLVSGYLVLRFRESSRPSQADEPSRTTQMWPVLEVERTTDLARKARQLVQAWHDEPRVTASRKTARSRALVPERGGDA